MEDVMYPVPVDEQAFPFSRIEIYPRQQLGRGSFGFVCKAKCDKLRCAAKLLHDVFFSFGISDPGRDEIIRKFNEECKLYSTINHPCIVQFLGAAILEERPVLLMELMDESLMSFIARSTDFHAPVGFHVEVDITHDVAMGLSYLHSRNIYHRDLSSNNILLSKGHKAKISDFGVSKLLDTEGSFTGLHSRNLTRSPGTPYFMPPEANQDRPRYSDKLDVFSLGVICIHLLSKIPPQPTARLISEIDSRGREIFIPVSEMERRQFEISKISPNHKLLSIAIYMINDKPDDRPSANEVCDRMEEVKLLKEYVESANEPSEEEKLLRDLNSCVAEKKQLQREIEMLKKEDKPGFSASFEVETLKMENLRLREELEEVKNLKLNKTSDNQNGVESVSTSSSRITDGSNAASQATTGSSSGPIEWKVLNTPTPCTFSRGSAASLGNKAYFSRPYSSVVHEFDVSANAWCILPSCKTEDFTLATFQGKLLAVGGVNSKTGTLSKSVQTFSASGLWKDNAFPNLFYARALPACVSSEEFLIAAGGSEGHPPCKPLSSVEIYSKQNNAWYCAYNLPAPLSCPVAVIRKDFLFVIGGSTEDGPSLLMYYCSLPYLFQWSNRLVVPVSMRQPWQQVQMPVASPAAVLLNNDIFIIGGSMGEDSGYQDNSNYVMKYKEHKKNFSISLMPLRRSGCMAVELLGSRVIVLGGSGSRQVDIGVLI